MDGVIPTLGRGYWQIGGMRRPDPPTPRQILSQNVRALMSERPSLDTIQKIVKASDKRLSNGKVGRITSASHATDVDTLDELAKVFGIEPWQLLVPRLNPHALPRLVDATVVNQLLDAVAGRTPMASEGKHSTTVTQASHNAPAAEPQPQLGPALKRATDLQGVGKRDSRSPGGVQKPGRSGGSS